MKFKFLFILSTLFLTACASKSVMVGIEDLPPTASGETPVSLAFWNKIGGKNVRALTRNARFPQSYSSTQAVTALDFPDTKGDKYGQRIAGYLEVPSDGFYNFYVSADESAEVWVSIDDKPANKRLVALVNKPSGYMVFDKFTTQKSRSISLLKGNRYFFEVLHKDHLGADYLNVSWSGPGFSTTTLTSENIKAYVQTNDSANAEAVYQEGYHVGYESGRHLSPYDLSYPIPDKDSDGLPDFYEQIIGLDINDPTDALSDLDSDLLTVLDEYLLRTSPIDADSDNDGIPDGFEVINSLDPNDAKDAYKDLDGDGVSNLEEYNSGSLLGDASSLPAPTTYQVSLSWAIPSSRADGSPLAVDEISGYRVYGGELSDALDVLTTVDDANVVKVSLTVDNSVTYFSISTLTVDGTESDLSTPLNISK